MSSVPWNADIEDLMEEWRLRAWAAQLAHYRIASRLRRYHAFLGVPVVVFTTAVGTSLFATLTQANLPTGLRVTIGSISVLAAIMAGVQTFFNFAARADQHVLAADWYASIRRKIEQQLRIPRAIREDAKEFMDGIRKEMNTVGSQFPEIGEQLWRELSDQFGIQYRPGDHAGSNWRRVTVDRT